MKNDKGIKILIIISVSVLVFTVGIIGFVGLELIYQKEPIESEVNSVISQTVSDITVSASENKDTEYSNLLLVNGKNPLPEDYDYEQNLIVIDPKYLNGYNNKINKDIAPYLFSMIEAAWKDGVVLFIRSPYRTYNDQKILFENQVAKYTLQGYDHETAEAKASTVVARPATSEHHTGLAVDFNAAEDYFGTTESYKWLTENAEEYGFILRYKAEKEHITGVIDEPWHWRYVGKEHAKKINELNMCLEEYVEYLGTTTGS
ncbi:MAG: M15 family metallopeptidase [Clostridia bacterium]|nr:M15 family metallopeptidase [Clostridia bacterium]